MILLRRVGRHINLNGNTFSYPNEIAANVSFKKIKLFLKNNTLSTEGSQTLKEKGTYIKQKMYF